MKVIEISKFSINCFIAIHIQKRILAPESHLRSTKKESGLDVGRRGLRYLLLFKSFPGNYAT